MDLAEKLAVLTLEAKAHSGVDVVLTDTEWKSSDADLVDRVANSHSWNTVWKALGEIAYDVGDQGLIDTVYDRENGDLDPATEKEIQQRAREEAYAYLPEIIANTPTRSLPRRLRDKNPMGRRPRQFVGWTPEQISKYYETQRAKRAGQKMAKEYVGDYLYGIFDSEGNNVGGGPVRPANDPEGRHSGWPQKAEAKKELATNFRKFPNPEDFSIRQFLNPRSTTALRSGIIPREEGWTTDEVCTAMRPLLWKVARNYLPQSNKLELKDLVQTGYLGVLDAFEKDKGKSPFTAFALLLAKKKMRTAALTGGVIKGSEKGEITQKLMQKTGVKPGGAASYGTRKGGFLTGYNLVWLDKDGKKHEEEFQSVDSSKGKENDPGYWQLKKRRNEIEAAGALEVGVQDLRGGAFSMDAPIGGEAGAPTFGSQLKGTKIKSPTYIARQRDAIKQLKAGAELTPRQERVLDATWGLDVPEAGLGAGVPGETRPGREIVVGYDVAYLDKDGKDWKTFIPAENPTKGREEDPAFKKAQAYAQDKKKEGAVDIKITDRKEFEADPEGGYYQKGKVGPRGSEPKMGPFVQTGTEREPGRQLGTPAPPKPTPTAYPRNAKQVGDMLGISKQRVRQLIATAMMKLCKSAAAKKSAFCKHVLGLPQEDEKTEETTCVRCHEKFLSPDKRRVRVCSRCKEAEEEGKARQPLEKRVKSAKKKAAKKARKKELSGEEDPELSGVDKELLAKLMAKMKEDPELLKKLTAECKEMKKIILAEEIARITLLKMLFEGELRGLNIAD
jgi:RNA polymerase sigma factor (sigma-70 family)